MPHQGLRSLQRPRCRPGAVGRGRRSATPPGRRSPASPSGPSRSRTSPSSPSAGSATTATPATAAATTSTSPGTTRQRPSSNLPNGSKCSRSGRSTPRSKRRGAPTPPPRSPRPAPPAASPRSAPAASARASTTEARRSLHRMRAMRAPIAIALTCLLAALAGGCGKQDDSTAAACLQGKDIYLAALAEAPRSVRLAADTPISECLVENQSGGDLATVGEAMVEAATELNAEAGPSRRHGHAAARLPDRRRPTRGRQHRRDPRRPAAPPHRRRPLRPGPSATPARLHRRLPPGL